MAEETVRICPEGDRALLVDFGNVIEEKTNRKVARLAGLLRERTLSGVRELMPAFSSLLVLYDPALTTYRVLKEEVEALLPKLPQDAKEGEKTRRIHHIPCCYGGALGEDLPSMEELTGLTAEEIIRIHAKEAYRIYMLGFLPGFVYLGGLDPAIACPRLPSPRKKIPQGAVGIGGSQTGIYPLASPGGWRLIGSTPVRMYDPEKSDPVLQRPGDFIRFVPVDTCTYYDIAREVSLGTYLPDMEETD